jgi:hypothetical protein
MCMYFFIYCAFTLFFLHTRLFLVCLYSLMVTLEINRETYIDLPLCSSILWCSSRGSTDFEMTFHLEFTSLNFSAHSFAWSSNLLRRFSLAATTSFLRFTSRASFAMRTFVTYVWKNILRRRYTYCVYSYQSISRYIYSHCNATPPVTINCFDIIFSYVFLLRYVLHVY